ncbi:MAG: hypothetical protein ACJASN_001277, partial [Cyclobacteriaceae bacterium]
ADLVQELTIDFSEDMLTAGSADPTIAFSVGTWTTTGNGTWASTTQWTESFTLTDGEESTTTVTVDVTGTRDANGNVQQDYTPEDEFDIDVLNPTVIKAMSNISIISDTNAGGAQFTLTVVYSEAMDADGSPLPVLTFPNDDVSATLANASGAWISNTTYVFTYDVLDGGITNGDIDVRVTSALDASGNLQGVYNETGVFAIDTHNPTVVLSDDEGDNIVRDGTSVTITATFTELNSLEGTPTIAIGSDISATSMTATLDPLIWTYAWTVGSGSASLNETATVSVSVTDEAGNSNALATGETSFVIDNTAPTVVLSDDEGDNIVKDAASVTITATFIEINSLGGTPTIAIGSDVSAIAMIATADPLVWTYAWTVGSGTASLDEIATVSVRVTDVAGNSNALATGETIFVIDNTSPTVVLSDDEGDNVVRDGASVNITATFNEINTLGGTPTIVIGSDVSSVVMISTANPLVWTYDWVVGSGSPLLNETATVSVSVIDAAGNSNALATGETSFVIDNTAPILTISEPSESESTDGPVTFVITITDEIQFDRSSLLPEDVIVNTTRSASVTKSLEATVNGYILTLSELVGVGYVDVVIPAGVALDVAGNSNIATLPTIPFLVRKILSVSADRASITHGEQVPDLNFSISGFQGTDNVDSLDVLPELITTATPFNCVAEGFSITFSNSGEDEYYLIETSNGQIDFIKKDLNAWAENQSMIYGDALPEFTFNYDLNDFVNNETPIDINIDPVFSSSATSQSATGQYTITISEAGEDECYNVISVSSTLEITKAPLSLTVTDKDTVFITEFEGINFSFSIDDQVGFRNNDNLTALNGTPIYSLTPNSSNPTYEFTIDQSGLSAENYEIDANPGLLRLFDPTAISEQPLDLQTCGSEPLKFAVTGSGSFSVRYQWQFKGPDDDVFVNVITQDGFVGIESSTLYADSIKDEWNGFEFRAIVQSDFGPDIFSQPVTLTIDPTPPPVFIDLKGSNILIAVYDDEFATYQWMKNGVSIDGATSQIYNSSEPLNTIDNIYSVVVYNTSGCSRETQYGFIDQSPFDDEFPNNNNNEIPIVVAPNPNQGVFSMTWSHPYRGEIVLKVVNMLGDEITPTQIRNKTAAAYTWNVDLVAQNPNLSAGIYFVMIQYGNTITSQKLFVR